MTMRKVLRSAPLAFKFVGDARGIIEGYASTFGGDPDIGGDIVAPGAFAKSLASHSRDGTRPAMLWHHNGREPIGVWTSVTEDAKGLRVKGRLSLDVPRARAAFALARDGALGLSIGYRTQQSARAARGRLLKDIALDEVSLVAMPMNRHARITSVKALNSNLADAIRATATALRKL